MLRNKVTIVGLSGCLAVWVVLGAGAAIAAQARAGQNIALNAKYTLWPRPNYSHCTDPGDAVQLTDGQSTTDYFWVQKGTVGWRSIRYATITVDLGRVEPISGAALTTAAGAAGVTWPLAIHVLTSDDGKTYRDAGDLVALDHKHNGPWPEGYAIRRLVTHELKTRGRFVQFVMIPLSGGPYTFVDEVEVFRGPAELLEAEPTGDPIADVSEFYQRGRVRRGVRHRVEADAGAIGRVVREAARLDEATRRRLLGRLEAVSGEKAAAGIRVDGSFRAVLPLGDAHAEVFRTQAELWRAMGRAGLSAWVAPTWDPLEPAVVPPSEPGGPIEVHLMQGEYRAAAFNLANATDRTLDVRLGFEGLPQAERPGYVTVHEVEWTDTSQGVPVAAALPEARRDGDGWRVSVLPGLVRQVWLTFHATGIEPGQYRGAIVAEAQPAGRLGVPIELRVWPFEFPRKTTLWLGGWSYTNDGGMYGVTRQNRDAFLAHLRERFVNAPWATAGVMMKFDVAGDPPEVKLDTRSFDDWIDQWPEAGRYMVFLSVPDACRGAKMGTPEFDRRVGAWISAWVAHLKGRGIAPDRLGLLLRDEPHEGSDVEPIVAWGRAIRAAEPEVLIWEDPTYRNPAKAPPELFEVCDVLCPNRPMWLAHREPFERFYLDQKARGKELQSYSCSGPARLLDPYSYYRLQAWHCWHYGATGSFFWALGDNSGSSSWNEYFARSGPYTPLLVDDETVTAGKQMEAIRESVEDYEYFVLLRNAVEQARSAGRADAAVRRAESLLAGAAESVLAAPGADAMRWHEPKDRTRADAVRVELLEALGALRSAKGPGSR